MRFAVLLLASLCLLPAAQAEDFPPELVRFVPYAGNPVFTAAGPNDWDARIRERGYILRTGNLWEMWYTGYDGQRESTKQLGYAISTDGLHWTRHPDNPLYVDHWVEDMQVLKHDGTYYMFAEGRDDIAQQLTSPDGLHWTRVGPLDIRQTSGEPISDGPRGTPTVWVEDDTWYLFYERGDQGVWLATSKDRRVWTNLQDDPVLARGPEPYDKFAVAMNQIVKHGGRYYGYYHAADTPEWKRWSTNVAVSDDLIHWRQYPGNPILEENKSSGIVVPVGEGYWLYSMHDQVQVHLPAAEK